MHPIRLRPAPLALLTLALLMVAGELHAQLFVERLDLYAIDTTPKISVSLPRGKVFDIVCSGTYSFWRDDITNDSVGLVDAAFYRVVPPTEFGFPGLGTTANNGFLLNRQPIALSISPAGMSPVYVYHVPFVGLGAPAEVFIEDKPPFSVDRHGDNTGMIRVEIWNVSPEIAVDTGGIDFGEREIGSTTDTLLRIENVGYGPLRLDQCVITGVDASSFSTDLPSSLSLLPGDGITVRVSFTPPTVFPKTAALVMRTNDSDSPLITIPLRGVGVTTLTAAVPAVTQLLEQRADEIPVTLGGWKQGSNTTSYRFDLVCDPALVYLRGVDAGGTLSAGWQVQASRTAPGRLHVEASGTTPLGGDGTLLRLRVVGLYATPPRDTLRIANLEWNWQTAFAGNPRARSTNGGVEVDSACNHWLIAIRPVALPKLGQNRPNPFNASTVIDFTLTEAADVRLVVYSLRGEPLRTLVSGRCEAGPHTVRCDLGDLPGGVYLYRLEGPGGAPARRMTLLR